MRHCDARSGRRETDGAPRPQAIAMGTSSRFRLPVREMAIQENDDQGSDHRSNDQAATYPRQGKVGVTVARAQSPMTGRVVWSGDHPDQKAEGTAHNENDCFCSGPEGAAHDS